MFDPISNSDRFRTPFHTASYLDGDVTLSPYENLPNYGRLIFYLKWSLKSRGEKAVSFAANNRPEIHHELLLHS